MRLWPLWPLAHIQGRSCGAIGTFILIILARLRWRKFSAERAISSCDRREFRDAGSDNFFKRRNDF
jgi:hypothetical protein